MKDLKVLSTKVTRTSDFAMFEVEKWNDLLELIEKILESVNSGINTRFLVMPKDNCKNYFVVLLASERDCNNSSVREILKGTNITLLFPCKIGK